MGQAKQVDLPVSASDEYSGSEESEGEIEDSIQNTVSAARRFIAQPNPEDNSEAEHHASGSGS